MFWSTINIFLCKSFLVYIHSCRLPIKIYLKKLLNVLMKTMRPHENNASPRKQMRPNENKCVLTKTMRPHENKCVPTKTNASSRKQWNLMKAMRPRENGSSSRKRCVFTTTMHSRRKKTMHSQRRCVLTKTRCPHENDATSRQPFESIKYIISPCESKGWNLDCLYSKFDLGPTVGPYTAPS